MDLMTLLCDVSLFTHAASCAWGLKIHAGRVLSSVTLLSMFSKLICIVEMVVLWEFMPFNIFE